VAPDRPNEAGSGRRRLAALLLRRERWLDAAVRTRLEARGLPALARSHSHVFANLDAVAGTRPVEIARRAGVSRQAIDQTLTELTELGLVQLAPDPSDGRAKRVTLTAAGERLVAAADEAFAELERDLAARIGRRRLRALREALEADWGEPG
jgi:DNA-binding MarR family transcriptional regulator